MNIIASCIILISSASTARDSAIMWNTQLRRFNPTLCCATTPIYDGVDGVDYVYYKRLSDLDRSITKLESPLRDSIRFSYVGTDENLHDTLLVKSNRDTCGLTYLIRTNPYAYKVFGIFPKPPKYFRQGKMVWNTTFDTLGVVGEVNCIIDRGIYVFDPKSISLKSIISDSSIMQRRLNANTQRSSFDSNNKDLIKSFEESARKDSINQINLACIDRSITAYTGKCPNDIVDTGNSKQDRKNPVGEGGIQSSQGGVYYIKPMIYLYPNKVTDYQISLDPSIPIVASYPKLVDNKWNIQAYPDGRIIEAKSGKEFYGLFWEGGNWNIRNNDSGIIVKPDLFPEVLDSLLTIKGLNYKEREEFVTFWISRMLNYKYVKIHFVDNEFSLNNKINIQPAPTGFIRVIAVFTGLNHYKNIPPETIIPRHRNPNDAVEWGAAFVDGTESNK